MDPGSIDARDPGLNDGAWSPLRAIAQWSHDGRCDEATWLAFLTTFFGPDERRGRDTWRAVRTVYSGFGDQKMSWETVDGDPVRLAELCRGHRDEYEALPRGNHRKYEPKRFGHQRGLGSAVLSVIELVELRGGVEKLFGGDDRSARARFDRLMNELHAIVSFGRTGCFDYLVLLGDLGVWSLEPGMLYLSGATGPLNGARRMLGRRGPLPVLDKELCAVADRIGVPVHAMEDALCNWQKK